MGLGYYGTVHFCVAPFKDSRTYRLNPRDKMYTISGEDLIFWHPLSTVIRLLAHMKAQHGRQYEMMSHVLS